MCFFLMTPELAQTPIPVDSCYYNCLQDADLNIVKYFSTVYRSKGCWYHTQLLFIRQEKDILVYKANFQMRERVTKYLEPKFPECNSSHLGSSGACFINILRALEDILSKSGYGRNGNFLWEFQAETLYMFPKPCLGHTHKVSAWASHHECDFGVVYFREIILECPQNVGAITPWLSRADVSGHRILPWIFQNVPGTEPVKLIPLGIKPNELNHLELTRINVFLRVKKFDTSTDR